jgi:hypothetical protein
MTLFPCSDLVVFLQLDFLPQDCFVLDASPEEAANILLGIEFDPLGVFFFLLLFKGLTMQARGSEPSLDTSIAIKFSASHEGSLSAKSLLNLTVVWLLLLDVVCPSADVN